MAARALDTLSFHADDARFDPAWLTGWEWVDRLFLEEGGVLRASTALEELTVAWPTLELVDAVIAHGTEAMPNLRRLNLETQALETTEHYAAIDASGLLDQLDAFDWLEKDVPYPFSTPEQRLEDIATWGAVAASTGLHVSLRRRAWEKLLAGCGYTLTHLRHLGRTVGLKGRSKMDAEELRAALSAMIPDDEGG